MPFVTSEKCPHGYYWGHVDDRGLVHVGDCDMIAVGYRAAALRFLAPTVQLDDLRWAFIRTFDYIDELERRIETLEGRNSE